MQSVRPCNRKNGKCLKCGSYYGSGPGNKRYCSVRCANSAYYLVHKKIRTARKTKMEVILDAISKSHDECVIWPFSKCRDGYGSIKYKNKKWQAHRLVLHLTAGPAPSSSHYACHIAQICHNPSCINKKHLYWGTPKQNCKDKLLDGSSNRGENQGLSKMTKDQVMNAYHSPDTAKSLAKRYNVNASTIGAIRRGISWSWLTGHQ